MWPTVIIAVATIGVFVAVLVSRSIHARYAGSKWAGGDVIGALIAATAVMLSQIASHFISRDQVDRQQVVWMEQQRVLANKERIDDASEQLVVSAEQIETIRQLVDDWKSQAFDTDAMSATVKLVYERDGKVSEPILALHKTQGERLAETERQLREKILAAQISVLKFNMTLNRDEHQPETEAYFDLLRTRIERVVPVGQIEHEIRKKMSSSSGAIDFIEETRNEHSSSYGNDVQRKTIGPAGIRLLQAMQKSLEAEQSK